MSHNNRCHYFSCSDETIFNGQKLYSLLLSLLISGFACAILLYTHKLAAPPSWLKQICAIAI